MRIERRVRHAVLCEDDHTVDTGTDAARALVSAQPCDGRHNIVIPLLKVRQHRDESSAFNLAQQSVAGCCCRFSDWAASREPTEPPAVGCMHASLCQSRLRLADMIRLLLSVSGLAPQRVECIPAHKGVRSEQAAHHEKHQRVKPASASGPKSPGPAPHPSSGPGL
jgi:hypothetical protein